MYKITFYISRYATSRRKRIPLPQNYISVESLVFSLIPETTFFSTAIVCTTSKFQSTIQPDLSLFSWIFSTI